MWHGTIAADLRTLGGTDSFARAINDRGQVVGDSDIAGDAGSHAALWDGATVTDLGAFNASDINSAGDVVGRSADRRAVLWSKDTLIDLNNLLDASTVDAGWRLEAGVIHLGCLCSSLRVAWFKATVWGSGNNELRLSQPGKGGCQLVRRRGHHCC
ncbi:hypothetical protein [Roseateles sp. P5_E4]